MVGSWVNVIGRGPLFSQVPDKQDLWNSPISAASCVQLRSADFGSLSGPNLARNVGKLSALL